MREIDLEIEEINKKLINEHQKISRFSSPNQFQAKLDQNIKTSKSISLYIESLEKELKRYTFQPKDLIVLIDFSETMTFSDGKKIKNAIKSAQNIFDIYITQEDKFALFLYSNSVNPVVSLIPKNINTFNYIKDVMDNLISNYSSYEYKGKTNLLKSLIVLKDYLKKKSKIFVI